MGRRVRDSCRASLRVPPPHNQGCHHKLPFPHNCLTRTHRELPGGHKVTWIPQATHPPLLSQRPTPANPCAVFQPSPHRAWQFFLSSQISVPLPIPLAWTSGAMRESRLAMCVATAVSSSTGCGGGGGYPQRGPAGVPDPPAPCPFFMRTRKHPTWCVGSPGQPGPSSCVSQAFPASSEP